MDRVASPEFIASCREAKRAYEECGGDKTEAAKKLGLAPSTFKNRLKRAEDFNDLPDQEQEKLGLLDVIRSLETQIKTIQRDNLTAQNVRKHILGLSEETPKPPSWLLSKTTKGNAGCPVTLWSDWHWGEVVDPAQVNNINEFDIAIAQERARRLVEKTVSLCKDHMVGANYPGIVVCLGGDMLSGDIHDELTETNDMPLMPAFLDLFGVLIRGLEILADEFGRVFVPCVPGNHGRNTIKPRNKNRSYSNFDWLLYSLLDRHFKRDKRIDFTIPAGADAYFEVMGRKFLLTHGDNLGVRGGDGIIGALGPILRGNFKTRNSNNAIGQPFDTLLIGHWHQYLPLPHVIVNGSLKGYDEFAKLKLRAIPEPPQQALFFVHPDYGITCNWAVLVDKVVKRTAPVDWVRIAA